MASLSDWLWAFLYLFSPVLHATRRLIARMLLPLLPSLPAIIVIPE